MQVEEVPAGVKNGVPFTQPFLNGRETELVTEVLRSGVLSRGPMLTRFERMFAELVGARHGIAVAGSSAGMHVAGLAAGWGVGAEVITSPLAIAATADAIRRTGATVTFADVDPETFTIDPAAVSAAITPLTRGIAPVDVFGWPTDVEALATLAADRDLTIVEDGTHALGACCGARQVGGGSGSPTVFGFHAGQQLATGEGGIICVDDDEQAAEIRALVDRHSVRMSDVTAAIGVAQIEKLPRVLALREMVASEYEQRLRKVAGVSVLRASAGDVQRAWFAYPIILDAEIDRDEVAERLWARGISCQRYVLAVHLQDEWRAAGCEPGMFPVAEAIADRSLAIPFFPQISPQQQLRVVRELQDVLETL